MWAVTTIVSVPPGVAAESLRQALEEAAVPAVRTLPGLRSAVWTLSDDHRTGVGFYVFETEEAARARASVYVVGAEAPGGVTISDVPVLQVLTQA
jgi:hypothetical protein